MPKLSDLLQRSALKRGHRDDDFPIGAAADATVELTSEEILALNTTPVEIVAAPGEGKFILPLEAFIVTRPGETPYEDNDGQFNLIYAAQAVFDADEIQVITFSGVPSAGTWTLTFEGQTTGNIDFDAAAEDIQAALEALSNVGVGDVGVLSSQAGVWYVTFTGALGGADRTQMTADDGDLVDGTVAVTTDTEGGPTQAINPNGLSWEGAEVLGDEASVAQVVRGGHSGVAISDIENQALQVFIRDNDPTAGDGTLVVSVIYSTVELP